MSFRGGKLTPAHAFGAVYSYEPGEYLIPIISLVMIGHIMFYVRN
jgi:hypothetical protein